MAHSPFEDAQDAFDLLKAHKIDGIEGVLVLDSGAAGPTVGITVCTHGNEYCGLVALTRLLRDLESGQLHHPRGKIVFTLNNMAATEAFFAGGDQADTKAYRFTDIDMNRLPLDFRDAKWRSVYEVRRSLELEPIWARFDYSVDIHSTSAPSIPMIVEVDAKSRRLSKTIPIQNIIGNIVPHLAGRPVASLYGRNGDHTSIVIEGGQHRTDETHQVTIQAVQNILFDLGVLRGAERPAEAAPRARPQDLFTVTAPIVFPDESYEFTRLFGNFESIPAGTVIAKGKGEDIVCAGDSVALFPKPFFKPLPNALNYEMMFLATSERVASQAA